MIVTLSPQNSEDVVIEHTKDGLEIGTALLGAVNSNHTKVIHLIATTHEEHMKLIESIGSSRNVFTLRNRWHQQNQALDLARYTTTSMTTDMSTTTFNQIVYCIQNLIASYAPSMR